MATIGLWLIGLITVTTLAALAVGAPAEKFFGPLRLRTSLGGRFLLVVAGFVGLLILDIIVSAILRLL